MKNNILFSETQRFKQKWLWLILAVVNGIILFGVYKQVIVGYQFGNNPMSNSLLISVSIMLITLTFFIANCKLETEIKTDGVYVRFFPFHIQFKYYSWEILTKSFVRSYSPILEYGGWGLRKGLFKNGDAYNVSGDKGLQLEFTDNKKLLIGTNKSIELTDILTKIDKLHE